jgi:hypothetical protein
MPTFGDDELVEVVSEALAPDPDVPADWEEAAFAAFSWRTIDQELLALSYDSLTAGAGAVRGGDGRVLEFSGGGLRLEVELSDRRVVGRLAGEITGTAELEVVFEAADGHVRSAAPDRSGFFSLDGEDHGMVRFAVRTDTARLVTEWIVL